MKNLKFRSRNTQFSPTELWGELDFLCHLINGKRGGERKECTYRHRHRERENENE